MPVTRRQRRGIAPAITGDASSLTQAESHKAPKALNGPEFIEASVISSVIELLDHSWVQNHWEVLDVPTSPCKVPDPLVDSLKGTDTAPESIDEDDPLALPDENTPPSPEVSPDGSACHESSTSESSDSGVVEAMVHSEQDPTALARMIESNKFLKSQRAEEETFDIANDTSPPTHLMCDVSDGVLPSALDSDEVAIKIEVTEDNGFTPPLASAVGDVALKMEIKTDDPEGVGGVAEAVTDTDAGGLSWTSETHSLPLEEVQLLLSSPEDDALQHARCTAILDVARNDRTIGAYFGPSKESHNIQTRPKTSPDVRKTYTVGNYHGLKELSVVVKRIDIMCESFVDKLKDPPSTGTSNLDGDEESYAFPESSDSTADSNESPYALSTNGKDCRTRIKIEKINKMKNKEKNKKKNKKNSITEKYKCPVCRKEYQYKRGLTVHLQAHATKKLHSCKVCSKSFVRKDVRDRHQQIHSKERAEFKCEFCGKSLTSKRNLKLHYESHSGERKYFCDVCGQKFYLKCVLVAHRKAHAGETPHRCDMCGRSFARHTTLVKHWRTHTGQRPYRCGQCGSRFSRQDVWRAHQKTHTARHSYRCELCGVSCVQKQQLRLHFGTVSHNRKVKQLASKDHRMKSMMDQDAK